MGIADNFTILVCLSKLFSHSPSPSHSFQSSIHHLEFILKQMIIGITLSIVL